MSRPKIIVNHPKSLEEDIDGILAGIYRSGFDNKTLDKEQAKSDLYNHKQLLKIALHKWKVKPYESWKQS